MSWLSDCALTALDPGKNNIPRRFHGGTRGAKKIYLFQSYKNRLKT
jgi:hypothetical protein